MWPGPGGVRNGHTANLAQPGSSFGSNCHPGTVPPQSGVQEAVIPPHWHDRC